ncbi:hypothetical protein HOLleu_03224 [Holothuria leucospilota]|uniref:Uncharacterized protein n=1 Tax=Holothuria leucospilota TaxID=206669 RepID=A0A9Q1CRP0_HOLLE|nr:hypothetical protein HOLleu_03224 [Holothuria leucospilota]
MDTGFFPVRLCKAFTSAVLFGVDSVTTEDLFNSFKRYISVQEADILDVAFSSFHELSTDQRDDLMDMLEGFEVRSVPKSKSHLNEVVKGICHKELNQKPKYILDCLAYTCKDLTKKDGFKSAKDVEKFFDKLKPTPKKLFSCCNVVLKINMK